MSKTNVKNNNLIDRINRNVVRHNIPIVVLFAGIIVGIMNNNNNLSDKTSAIAMFITITEK